MKLSAIHAYVSLIMVKEIVMEPVSTKAVLRMITTRTSKNEGPSICSVSA